MIECLFFGRGFFLEVEVRIGRVGGRDMGVLDCCTSTHKPIDDGLDSLF